LKKEKNTSEEKEGKHGRSSLMREVRGGKGETPKKSRSAYQDDDETGPEP